MLADAAVVLALHLPAISAFLMPLLTARFCRSGMCGICVLTPTVVCAVHFGMSGRFNAAVGPAPEVRPTTRLALVNEEHNIVAHLSAMTVKHGGLGEMMRHSLWFSFSASPWQRAPAVTKPLIRGTILWRTVPHRHNCQSRQPG